MTRPIRHPAITIRPEGGGFHTAFFRIDEVQWAKAEMRAADAVDALFQAMACRDRVLAQRVSQ